MVDTKLSSAGIPDQAEAIDVSAEDHIMTLPGLVYVGTGGNVKVDAARGGTVTFNNLADGDIIPCLITKVYSTGTTATGLLGLF